MAPAPADSSQEGRELRPLHLDVPGAVHVPQVLRHSLPHGLAAPQAGDQGRLLPRQPTGAGRRRGGMRTGIAWQA